MQVFDYGANSWARSRRAIVQEHGGLGRRYLWKVQQNGILVDERENIVTTLGRKLSVGLWFGAVPPPLYLGLDAVAGLITSVTTTSVTVSGNTSASNGDTIILSLGSVNEETTSAVTVAGSTMTWSTPTTLTHSPGDIVVRVPTLGDTALVGETDYADSFAPNQRKQMASPVYSDGLTTGQWFFNGAEAQFPIYGLGLWDDPTIGNGVMWNHLAVSIPLVHGNQTTVSVEVSYA